MRRAVFLDRDGTINAMVYNPDFGLVDSPANPNDLQLLPGAGNAIRMINRSGLLAVVISNQPGIAKSRFTLSLLEATTAKLCNELSKVDAYLDAFYYCLHHPQSIIAEYRSECDCRKPKPGLLRNAAQDLDIELEKSYMVGDGITDVLAGKAVGCTTFFLNSRKCYNCLEFARHNMQFDYIVSSLTEAVQIIQKLEAGAGNERFEGASSWVTLHNISKK